VHRNAMAIQVGFLESATAVRIFEQEKLQNDIAATRPSETSPKA
jgi:hypothetical protein